MNGFAGVTDHLLAELQRLELLLQRQVLRLRASKLLAEDHYRGLYISDAQVDALLQQSLGQGSGPSAEYLEAIKLLDDAVNHLAAENATRTAQALRGGVNLPLLRLAELFDLARFELDALLLALAPELDLRYETLYAYVQNDVTRRRPTVELALKLFCTTLHKRLTRRGAFTADAPLLRQHLIQLCDDPQERDPALPARFLKLDQRIVDFILGHDTLDERLQPFVRALRPTRRADDLDLPAELAERLTLVAGAPLLRGGVFLLRGPYGAGKQTAAEAICAAADLPLLVADLQRAHGDWAATLPILRREALLRGAGLYVGAFETLIENESPGGDQRAMALVRDTALPSLPLFLGSTLPWYPAAPPAPCFIDIELSLPDYPARVRLWERELARDTSLQHTIDTAVLARRFALSPGQIANTMRAARQQALLRPPERQVVGTSEVGMAARTQSGQELRRLAQKIEPRHEWADLVLPARAVQQLREICIAVRQRQRVYGDWGFERRLAQGKGLNVLFSGPSGTGKTMAASILACELELDLYRIDLSTVVSKYIGETEKNLSRVFHAAQASNAILFFDEADALFGKRSEVKDAHDRYANIEVAYLLTQMESYAGTVILATNLSKNLDEAFARRMQHSVEFPFPDAPNRERIWQGMLPEGAPLGDDVDFAFLARQFELAGGNIRNVVLSAAFLAAEDGGRIGMRHMILATAREWQKLGKLPSKSDFRQYYELIREHT